MGLGFHIGQIGIDGLTEYIGDMEQDELYWLQKNGFLIAGKTGALPEDPVESFPYFDDVVLTHEQVVNVKTRFDEMKKEVSKTPGFKSSAVDKMDNILNRIVTEQKGLSTYAD
jgi:hypothetical protein